MEQRADIQNILIIGSGPIVMRQSRLRGQRSRNRGEAAGVEKGVALELLESLPHLLKLPSKQIWFDFDEEADVLYVSFERPQGATDSELSEDGILMRYRGDQLVGITILNVRKRIASAR